MLTMDQKETMMRKIQRNKCAIVEAILPNIQSVAQHLLEEEEITRPMFERIMCKETRYDKAFELLDLLYTREESASEVFFEGCKKHGLFGVADILDPSSQSHFTRPKLLPQKHNDQSNSQWSPPEWPTEQDLKEYTECTLKPMIVVDPDVKRKHKQSLHNSLQGDIYPMRHKIRGHAVIINILKFKDSRYNRSGSEKDVKAMGILFSSLGFIPHISKDNLTAEEMKAFLQKEGKHDFTNDDCLIVFIMSHGADGKIYGSDFSKKTTGEVAGYISVKDVRKLFWTAKGLVYKPKLFFIQACRNDESQDHCDVPDSPDADNKTSKGDILTIFATCEGDRAFRSKVTGSWFPQAIFYIFSRFAGQERLEELLKKVRSLIAQRCSSSVSGTQILEYSSSMFKTFYFFPALSEEQN